MNPFKLVLIATKLPALWIYAKYLQLNLEIQTMEVELSEEEKKDPLGF